MKKLSLLLLTLSLQAYAVDPVEPTPANGCTFGFWKSGQCLKDTPVLVLYSPCQQDEQCQKKCKAHVGILCTDSGNASDSNKK